MYTTNVDDGADEMVGRRGTFSDNETKINQTHLEDTLLHRVTGSTTSDAYVESDVRPDAELDRWGCDNLPHSAGHIVRLGGPLIHFW